MVGGCSLSVGRVYRLYHKVHSAGWGNVWCSHCDWREQPPPLIPLVLLHDISGKDIPPPVKPSLVLSLFSVHPPPLADSYISFSPSIISLVSNRLVLTLFLLKACAFLVSLPSAPLPSTLPYKHGRIWVCVKGFECVTG